MIGAGPCDAMRCHAMQGDAIGFAKATCRDRTGDLLITNQLLYQLS